MRKCFMLVACAMAVFVADGRAQPNNPDVTNGSSKYWIVRYHKREFTDQEVQHKGRDVAIRVRLQREPEIENGKQVISGEIWRYDRVRAGKYKQRRIGGHIPLRGTIERPGGGRRRMAFRVEGTLDQAEATTHIIVAGFCHIGRNRGQGPISVHPRDDHRLQIRKTVTTHLKTAVPRQAVPGKAVTKSAVPEMVDPCPEEPDTDVLEEEVVESDPPDEPEYDEP